MLLLRLPRKPPHRQYPRCARRMILSALDLPPRLSVGGGRAMLLAYDARYTHALRAG